MNMEHLGVVDALMIFLIGFLTVFCILLVISLIVRLNSWVIGKLEHKRTLPKGEGAVPARAGAETSSSNGAGDLSDEDLVIITAAIAAAMGTSPDKLIIRDIKPANTSSGWAASARQNNLFTA